MRLNGENCFVANDSIDKKIYVYEKSLPKGVVSPCSGAIYMYIYMYKTTIFKHVLENS